MDEKPALFPSSIKYKFLEKKHDDYKLDYWEKLRALYEGGHTLFSSPQLQHMFLKHAHEQDTIYNERKKRAFYVNYAGEIIDYICAALLMHPVHVENAEDAETEQFYKEFEKDVSPTGGERVTLHNHVGDQIREALIYGRVWTMVDFPANFEPLGVQLSEATQDEAGLLDAYALSIAPQNVYDWSVNQEGKFDWVKLCFETKKSSYTGEGANITKHYTIYTSDAWARYELTYNPELMPPTDETSVTLKESGVHSFERVPVIPLVVPPGLWAMNKLCSVALEHFNKRCALSWAEYKSLFAERYEFLSSCDDVCDELADDKERAVNQVRGQGYTQIRAQDDRVEYVGPPTEAFAYSAASLNSLRDEMHRITHQMALSVSMDTSSVRRSGDSKEQDRQDTVVILNALGQIAREHVYQIYSTIAAGRGDTMGWVIRGLDEFEDLDVSGTLSQALVLKDVDIPSPKFKVESKFEVARAVVGQIVSADVLKDIRSEIEEAYKNEKPETAEAKMLRTMQQAPGMVDNQFGKEPHKNRDNKNPLTGQDDDDEVNRNK